MVGINRPAGCRNIGEPLKIRLPMTQEVNMKTISKKYAETALQRHVRNWLNSQGKDGGYDDGATGAYEDLQNCRCSSGMVGHLIYYTDTVRFYRRHQREIDGMLKSILDDCGGSIADLFRDWDDSDPLARDTSNQNLLAWFGFEEAARIVYERAEQEAE